MGSITEKSYEMGKMPLSWKNDEAKSITFIVTEDCNLICKYCYLTGKNETNKMNFETAKKAVDYILNTDSVSEENDAVVWEFIGGEPFMEIELIDNICDYIKQQMFLLNHKWFDFYRFSFSTNGILYDRPEVQNFIAKNYYHLSIGITIDGTKEKHDLNRIYKDGRGSYDDVVRNVPMWLEQFPGTTTKVTFASSDLPYLKDSIIHLWKMGIKNIPANVVFEDVWKDGDDLIFENQLLELADYILENDMWKDYSVRFFDEDVGHPLVEEGLSQNFCGSGRMLAIDPKGNLFPCIRFADYSLSNRKGLQIGDVYTGINPDKVRPFLALNLVDQSREECINCKVASNCGWCQGCNYDMADSDTVYQRATFICKMHKANSRANKYFWTKFKIKTGIISEYERKQIDRNKRSVGTYLQFITSDDITPHCCYKTNEDQPINIMSDEIMKKGIAFSDENDMIPMFLTNELHLGNCISGEQSILDKVDIPIYRNENILSNISVDNCILLMTRNDIGNLSKNVLGLFKMLTRVNLVIQDLDEWDKDDLATYQFELESIALEIIAIADKAQVIPEINVLTDIFDLKSMSNCDAGIKSYSLAPNGKLYLCPAFYFDNQENSIGSLEEGINIKNPELLKLSKAPICSACDAFHCQRCKYLNKKLTGEYNTPSAIQCHISHIERLVSFKIQNELIKNGYQFDNILQAIDYMDPLTKIYKPSNIKCR